MMNSIASVLNRMHGGVGTGAIRLRQARKTSLAQIVNRIITTGVGLASIPLAIAILGREEYGVWLIMVSFITWFSMSDLGLPSALMNPLAAAIGLGDSKRIRDLVSTSSLLLAFIGIGVAAIGCVFVLLLPVEQLLGMTNPQFSPPVRWAIVWLVLFNIATLPLRLSGVMALSMQKGYWTAIEETLAELVVLAGLVGLRVLGGNLAMFALVVSVPMAAGRLLLWLFICIRFGTDFAPRLRNWSRQMVKNIMPNGAAFFVGSLGELLVLQTPYIIIARTLGAAAVPLFAIPYQLFYSAFAVLNTIANPLWPAYAEAKAKGDHLWIRRVHWRIMRESMILAILGFSLLGLLSTWFITMWAGPEYIPSTGFVGVLILLFIQWSWNYVFVVLLTGLGLIRERTVIILCFGVLNVIVSTVLTNHIGMNGIAVGMFTTMLLTVTWSTSWAVHKRARWIFVTPTGSAE